MYFKEICVSTRKWFDSAHDKHWRALVNAALNLNIRIILTHVILSRQLLRNEKLRPLPRQYFDSNVIQITHKIRTNIYAIY